MNTYICFYNNRKCELKAASLYAAKKAALEVFRVPRTKEHMVSVVLAEKDGVQVVHSTQSIA